MIASIDAETVVITFIHNKIPECIRHRKIVP